MNPYIELLKSEFTDICANFYVAQIDDYFSSAGFANLNKKYNHRRDEVSAYYELMQANASIVIEDFFLKLFSKYEIYQEF
jgi:hypothetical protein